SDAEPNTETVSSLARLRQERRLARAAASVASSCADRRSAPSDESTPALLRHVAPIQRFTNDDRELLERLKSEFVAGVAFLEGDNGMPCDPEPHPLWMVCRRAQRELVAYYEKLDDFDRSIAQVVVEPPQTLL